MLAWLQTRGRSSLSEMAAHVGRSESSVRDRLCRLEGSGIVRGYRADLDWQALGVRSWAVVRAECDLPDARRIAGRLESDPRVLAVALASGPKPLAVMVAAADAARLAEFLQEGLPEGVRCAEASSVLQWLLPPRPPELCIADPGGPAGEAAVPPWVPTP